MSQKKEILNYLNERGSITRLQAATELYIFELSSRIGELEALGYVFNKERIGGKLRSGKQWRGVRYSLLAEAKCANE